MFIQSTSLHPLTAFCKWLVREKRKKAETRRYEATRRRGAPRLAAFAAGRPIRKHAGAVGSGYDGPLTLRRSRQCALPLMTLALLVSGCKPPEQPAVTSIVGAVLIDGTGGPPDFRLRGHHRERADSRGGRAREFADSAGSGEDRWRGEVRGAGPDRRAARNAAPGSRVHCRPAGRSRFRPGPGAARTDAVVWRLSSRCATPAPWWTAASRDSCT